MGETDDDAGEWTGRPHDDPALLRLLNTERARFRAERPPFDCWIDCVSIIELYQRGVLRARVTRGRAEIAFLNSDGGPESSIIYLRSENPYDVAERHLGIAPVAEIRDESNEAEDPISSLPRDWEARDAEDFRRRYSDREDEIFHYLRQAVRILDLGEKVEPAEPDLAALLAAITSAARNGYEDALVQVRAALAALEGRAPGRSDDLNGRRECRRAILAIERHLAIQNRPAAGHWKPKGGKSGG